MFKRDFKSTINLSHFEGGLYALMAASIENFILFYAISIGITPSELGLISTLPLLMGALAQLIIPSLVEEKDVGKFVILTMILQVFGTIGIFLHSIHHYSFYWLLGSVVLYYTGGMTSTPFWIDWAQNLIPKSKFTKFMARRNSYTMWMVVIFVLTFASLGHFFSFPIKYIFLVGVLARTLSSILQIYIQKGNYLQKKKLKMIHKPVDQKRWHFNEIKNVGKNLKRTFFLFLFATAIFKFGVQIASPFIVSFAAKDLKLDLLSFTFLFSLTNIGRAFFFKHWAKTADGIRIYQALLVSTLYLSFIPLVWTVSKSLVYLCIMEAVAGLFWGGFDLLSVLSIQKVARKNSRKYLGINMALGSLFGLLGAMLGARILENGFSFHEVMFYGFLGRFGIWIFWFLAVIYFITYGRLNFQRLKVLFLRFVESPRS